MNQLPGWSNKKIASTCLLILFITAGCRFYFKTTSEQLTIEKKETSFEKGKNLAFNVCGGCHYDPATGKFTGKRLNSIPRIAGRLYSANLTNSATNGITSTYSDAELFYLLKTGIGRDGKFLPYMMRPMMADNDINDVILYLRSGDGPVADGDTTIGITHINLIGRMGMRLAAHPQPYNKNIPVPPATDAVEYGRYLVAVIGCYHCHSKKMFGLDYLEPEHSKGYMAGGVKMKDPQGKRLRGSNLTPDKETGIGNITRNDFRRAVRDGIMPSGKKLRPPMEQFHGLTEMQVDAIFAYVQHLPPTHHKVKGQEIINEK